MEKMIIKKLGLGIIPVVLFLMVLVVSCNDKTDLGNPQIISVYKLDTFARHKDSTFVGAEAGTLLVVRGQNIGGVRYAYFNGYSTSFNPNYNSNTSLIITVPGDAPVDSTASNTLRLVTSRGEASFSFKIIAKPIIRSRSNAFFGGDRDNITFTGKNLADIVSVFAIRQRDSTEVVVDSVECEIISKRATEIVVKIPDNSMSRVVLRFTNTSGAILSEPFVNATMGQFFYTDSFGQFISPNDPNNPSSFNGDGWEKPFTENSDYVLNGTKSLSIFLFANSDKWFGFTNWWPRFFYDKKYTHIAFAVKGGAKIYPLWLTSEVTKAGGLGGYPDLPKKNRIDVAPNIWSFYLIAIKDLDLLYTGVDIPRIGFRPKEKLVTTDQMLYFDDIMLIE